MEEQNVLITPPGMEPTPVVTLPKKRGFFKKFLYTILVLGIIAVIGLGYLGFMPGVSKIFGSNKPRSLGVVASSSDQQMVATKLAIQYLNIPGTSLSTSGSQAFSGALTDTEITALIASHENLWASYPVSDVQVKFNQDGTAEVSGILRTDRIYDYAAATGIDASSVKKWLDKVNVLVDNPPFYIKGSAEVTNGVLAGSLSKVEIGRLPIPISLIAPRQDDIVSFAENRLERAGIRIDSGKFQAGAVKFTGSLPTQVNFPAR